MNLLNRLCKLPEAHSFFLFGPRGAGKSSLLRQIFADENTLWLDLLEGELEAKFIAQPDSLAEMVERLPATTKTIVIDEVQKAPALLNAVHRLIEKKQGWIFVLSGSSARKLKRGGANLLAGRALWCTLDPFLSLELGSLFDLAHALHYGMLPRVWNEPTAEFCQRYLRTYAHTYLKEEIAQEQIVRRLDPFRKFLEVAAQNNGKILNQASVARDCGVSDKTVGEYYTILEDTLLGFFLEPFHHSFRKRLRTKPKFYLFDLGVARALAKTTTVPVVQGTSYYGELFECHVILEIRKLINIFSPDTRISYLQTEGGREIDLVIERPGLPIAFVEIKSANRIRDEHLESLRAVMPDFPDAIFYCLSQETIARLTVDNIHIVHWQKGLQELFAIADKV